MDWIFIGVSVFAVVSALVIALAWDGTVYTSHKIERREEES